MQRTSPDYKARKQGKPTIPLRERLYSKIKVNEYTGCWEWQGTLDAIEDALYALDQARDAIQSLER